MVKKTGTIPSFDELVETAYTYDKKTKKIKHKPYKLNEDIRLFNIHITDYDYNKLIALWKRIEKIRKASSIDIKMKELKELTKSVKNKSPVPSTTTSTMLTTTSLTESTLLERVKKAKEMRRKMKMRKTTGSSENKRTKHQKQQSPPSLVSTSSSHEIKIPTPPIPNQITPLKKSEMDRIVKLKSLKEDEALKRIDEFSDHILIEFARQYYPEMYNEFTMGMMDAESFRTGMKINIAKMVGIVEDKAMKYFTKSPFTEIK